MISFKPIVVGLGLLAMTTGSSSALTQLEAYCDNYAQDYARQATKVGENVAGAAIIGALIGAGIGNATNGGGPNRTWAGAGIGAGLGAGVAAAASSGEYQKAYNTAFASCMNANAQPVANNPDACNVGSQAWVNFCKKKAPNSFNPQTGTYRGFDGQDHFCLPNYC